MSMKVYKFRQNNSGGSYDIGSKVATTVFIEATSAEQANELAVNKTDIYFDEDYYRDCECCGTRWSRAEDKWDEVDESLEELKGEYKDSYPGNSIDLSALFVDSSGNLEKIYSDYYKSKGYENENSW